MIDLDTKTIINFLPFEPKYKLELLENFDNLPRNEQLRISDLAWQAYCQLHELKIQENFDKGVEEAQKTGLKLDQTFFGKILDETDREMETALTTAGEGMDLSTARKSMEKILGEIRASKKVPITQANPQKAN